MVTSRGPSHADAGHTTGERHPAFDDEALACLPALRRYALHLSGTEMDAEDLVQDAFLRALRSWRRYTPGTRMLAWLRTILYRRFVSELRARRRLVPLASAEDALRLEPGGRRLSSTTVDPLLAAELGAAFALLTPALSESVRLSDWEGFGDEEIAAIADIPVGTAKSRLSRGRRLLRLAMHDAGLERGFREAGASRR